MPRTAFISWSHYSFNEKKKCHLRELKLALNYALLIVPEIWQKLCTRSGHRLHFPFCKKIFWLMSFLLPRCKMMLKLRRVCMSRNQCFKLEVPEVSSHLNCILCICEQNFKMQNLCQLWIMCITIHIRRENIQNLNRSI